MLRRKNRKEWVITEPGKDSPNGSKNRERVWSGTIVGFILLCVNIYILMNTHLSKRVAWRLTFKHRCRCTPVLCWWTFRENIHSNIPTKYNVIVRKGEQLPISSVLFNYVSFPLNNSSFFFKPEVRPAGTLKHVTRASDLLTFAVVYWYTRSE